MCIGLLIEATSDNREIEALCSYFKIVKICDIYLFQDDDKLMLMRALITG